MWEWGAGAVRGKSVRRFPAFCLLDESAAVSVHTRWWLSLAPLMDRRSHHIKFNPMSPLSSETLPSRLRSSPTLKSVRLEEESCALACLVSMTSSDVRMGRSPHPPAVGPFRSFPSGYPDSPDLVELPGRSGAEKAKVTMNVTLPIPPLRKGCLHHVMNSKGFHGVIMGGILVPELATSAESVKGNTRSPRPTGMGVLRWACNRPGILHMEGLRTSPRR